MNKQISDGELITIVRMKAEAERQLTLEVIELLQEIYSRRLHLKRGYSSLHEFCVKELKYSDGAAHRRIKAMKLVVEIPEVVEAIQSGSLNLSTVSQLQCAFEAKSKAQKPLSHKEKSELIDRVRNQSRREAERTIASVCPETVKTAEKIKQLNSSQMKIELLIECELFKKIERLKALTSHKNKSLVELFESLVDQELKRRDPELKLSKRPASGGIRPVEKPGASPAKTNLKATESHQASAPTRYISSAVKHFVWTRDGGRCTYVDPASKRRCESQHKITFEHIKPYSLGGGNTAENLRLLCTSHNALTAITAFGIRKMESFRSGFPVKT